ncbi:MAG: 30S ribosomal protein S6e [Candidatus Nanohaloarchaeota archaeon QJJ-7]|nr:30S ribosomal protein S6e [Candidatus Nanohaloarchaeota archaeon QJJ-7]
MKAVIGTESGETHQFELEDRQVQALTGLEIGGEVDGSVLGLDGYTLEITGGSDTEGFPMKESVEGTQRKQLLVKEGTGARDLEHGERKRKSVRGNTVSRQIAQLNLGVVEEGDDSIGKLLGEEPEEDTEEPDEEVEDQEDEEVEEESEDAEEEGEEEQEEADEETAEEEDEETGEEEGEEAEE